MDDDFFNVWNDEAYHEPQATKLRNFIVTLGGIGVTLGLLVHGLA